MITYSNYWLDRRERRKVVDEINKLLEKFVGHKLNSIDDLHISMRKVVIKYFKNNLSKTRYFSPSLHYDFEVEEVNGYVAIAKFVV